MRKRMGLCTNSCNTVTPHPALTGHALPAGEGKARGATLGREPGHALPAGEGLGVRAKAFSMVELIISMAIITIVISFLFAFLDANQRRHRSMQLLAMTSQGGRSAFEVLAQDLNQAGFNPPFKTNRTVSADVTPSGSTLSIVTLSGSGTTPITQRVFYGSRLAMGGGCVPTAQATIVDAPGGTAPLSATIAPNSTATISPPNTASIAVFSQSNILQISSRNIVASTTFTGTADNGAGGNTIYITGAGLTVLTPGETVKATLSGFPTTGAYKTCGSQLNNTFFSTVLSSPAPSSTQFAFQVPTAPGIACSGSHGGSGTGSASGAGVTLPNVATIVTTAAHGFLNDEPVQISSGGFYTVTYPGTNCPSGSTQCFSVSSASLPASSTIYPTTAASTATAGGAGRISNTVTVVTATPHGFVNGESVTVAGVSDPSFNGTFTVASTPTTQTFSFSQTAADSVSGSPVTPVGTAGTYGATRAGGTSSIITIAPHGFSAGQTVTIISVTDTTFNGAFTIASVPSTYSFTYTQAGQPASSSGNGTASEGGGAQRVSGTSTITTTAAHGFTQGQTVVISGTTLGFNGTYPILTVPSSTTFSYLQTGQPDQLSGGGTATAGGASRDATGKVEIVTTAPHGFLVGEQVNVSGVTDSTFNMGGGTTAAITAVPNSSTFTYTVGSTIVASSSGGTAQVGGASRTSNTDYIVTTTPNGFSVGQTVNVSSVSSGSFNGSFVVKTILSPTVFSYTDNGGDQGSGGGNAAVCNYDMQEVVVNNDPNYGTTAMTTNSVPVVLTSGLKAGTPVYSRNYPFPSGIYYNNETPGVGLGIADNKLLFYGDILNTGDLYYGEYRLQCVDSTSSTGFSDACTTNCLNPPYVLTRFLTKLALTSGGNTGVFAIPASKATAFDGAQVAPLVTNIQGKCASPTGSGGATGVVTLGTGDGATTTFSGSITPTPLTPGTITVQVGSPATVVGKDDAAGNVSGAGITGTVNYTSGAVSVTVSTPPAAGVGVTASASVNWLVYTAPDETSPSGTTGVTAAYNYTTSTYVNPLLNPDGTPVVWFKVDTYGAIDNTVTPPAPYFQTFIVDVRVALTLQESQIDPETQTYRIQRLRTHIVPRNINDSLNIAKSGGSSNLPGTPYDPTTALCATGCRLPLP